MSGSFDLPALQRLTTIEHVHAAFVFEQRTSKIVAREVPPQYSDHALEQVAMRVTQIAKPLVEGQLTWKEFRLGFENFTVWVRTVAQKYVLVIFVDSNISHSQLRQPINLAVLNVDKGIRAEEEKLFQHGRMSQLAESALQAERDIYLRSGNDSNHFLSRLNTLALFYVGPIGPEVVEHGCRELNFQLPITDVENMREAAKFVGQLIPNPDRKAHFTAAADRLIQQVEWESAQKPKG
jgi:hypothetical protein